MEATLIKRWILCLSLAFSLFLLWDVAGLKEIVARHDSIPEETLSPNQETPSPSSEERASAGDAARESSKPPESSSGSDNRGEDAPKSSHASDNRGEDAPESSPASDNRGEDAPESPHASDNRGEDAPKSSPASDNRGEDASKSPHASDNRGEDASKSPHASDNRGEDAPESSGPKESVPQSKDIAEDSPLAGRIICIDPGHCVTPLMGKGLTAPVSPLSDAQKPLYVSGTEGKHLTEEKLNLIVGLKLRDALKELGADVLMTREVSEISVSNVERSEIANNAGADVNIHIHADGSDNPKAHGVSVLIPDGDLLGTPSIKEESARLGKLMVDAVAESTGAKNRGTVPRDDMTGFNFSQVPTVLIEMGFMTNPEEDALLETDAYQDKIVKGMVTSLLQWYGADS